MSLSWSFTPVLLRATLTRRLVSSTSSALQSTFLISNVFMAILLRCNWQQCFLWYHSSFIVPFCDRSELAATINCVFCCGLWVTWMGELMIVSRIHEHPIKVYRLTVQVDMVCMIFRIYSSCSVVCNRYPYLLQLILKCCTLCQHTYIRCPVYLCSHYPRCLVFGEP